MKSVFIFFRAPKQYIRMISEGSCDKEYWSNDTDNSDFPSVVYVRSFEIG